jgi:predicted transcriptional regulator
MLACEYSTKVIIPNLKMLIIEEGLKRNLPKNKLAQLLGISTATVCKYSQRKSNKIVELMKKDEELMDFVRIFLSHLLEGYANYMEICEMCIYVRKKILELDTKCYLMMRPGTYE